jgi:hypothetical protein
MSQTQLIRFHLESGLDLTPLEALDRYGTFRLAARIDELRHDGLAIDTLIETRGGKRYARYRLHEPVQLGLLG